MRLFLASTLAIIVVWTGCAPATAPSPAQPASGASGESRTTAAPKRLTIALQNEPKALYTIRGGEGGGAPAAQMLLAVHQNRAMYTDVGEPYPMLATELPSQARGTWLVRPDGTMQTTYTLRPGVDVMGPLNPPPPLPGLEWLDLSEATTERRKALTGVNPDCA